MSPSSVQKGPYPDILMLLPAAFSASPLPPGLLAEGGLLIPLPQSGERLLCCLPQSVLWGCMNRSGEGVMEGQVCAVLFMSAQFEESTAPQRGHGTHRDLSPAPLSHARCIKADAAMVAVHRGSQIMRIGPLPPMPPSLPLPPSLIEMLAGSCFQQYRHNCCACSSLDGTVQGVFRVCV